MPLRGDLLLPIPGENPSGCDIRYDTRLGSYDQIKEARRQDDELAQGVWQHERKSADYALAARLGQDILAGTSKDLQVAAWVTEAMLHLEGFAGLKQGLDLCQGLVKNFWDTLYPPFEDELRSAPLNWLGSNLEIPLKSIPLVQGPYNWFHYKESRAVGYEEQAKTEKEKKTRAKLIAESKLAPEVFDKTFAETPKAFYERAEKDLDGCLAGLKSLDGLCDEKFRDEAPSLGKLRIALEEVRHTLHTLLEKKRETEPDPVPVSVETNPSAETEGSAGLEGAASPQFSNAGELTFALSFEPPQRREAVAAIARAAAALRKTDPYSPAPYLLMRGLRWGELRGTQRISDPKLLEAPPTELRQHIKRLALEQKWAELLEAAETAMALPCSRGWLDLQRLVVMACMALGPEYGAIAAGIRSELRTLLRDVPELVDANLLDDTPAANPETKAWLLQPNDFRSNGSDPSSEAEGAVGESKHETVPTWLARATDPYTLAKDALKSDQAQKAFDIMRKEIRSQRSGRGKFQRTIQLVQLCIEAGKDSIAQPLLDDLGSAIETHKLDDWEDPEMVASALITLMKFSKRLQSNANERQKLFERICRLDPAQALGAG